MLYVKMVLRNKELDEGVHKQIDGSPPFARVFLEAIGWVMALLTNVK
jgi:hypothetical protein